MAEVIITHRCGHCSTVDLFGHSFDQRQRAHVLGLYECRVCRDETVQERNYDRGLPTLRGSSDRQIKWAESIREVCTRSAEGRLSEWVKEHDVPPTEFHKIFFEQIQASRKNPDSRRIYAGWLEEQGEPDLAGNQRILAMCVEALAEYRDQDLARWWIENQDEPRGEFFWPFTLFKPELSKLEFQRRW